MELVAGPVEVGGHEVGDVLAVLLAVGLGLDEVGQLGDAVGGVGLLGIALPQRVLAERDRRVLRVRADRSRDHGLGGRGQTGLLDDVGAHEQVVEVEVRRAGHVGTDAAHAGGEVDHEIGPDGVEEPGHVVQAT
jgi:hypothetical protein